MLLGSLDSYTSKKVPSNSLTFKEVTTRTQGNIEGHFNMLKTIDFQDKRHLRADEFLKEQYTRLDARLVDIGESLLRPKKKCRKKQTGNRLTEEQTSQKMEMEQEMWCKRVKRHKKDSGKISEASQKRITRRFQV